MQFQRITDDLSISKLGLGTVGFGTTVDEAASFAIMDAYFAGAAIPLTPPRSTAAGTPRESP